MVRITAWQGWRRFGVLSLLCACDPMVHYVVTRRAAIGAACPDATRDFVLTRKRSCCLDRDPEVSRGRITFGADEDRREVDGSGEIHLTRSEYLDVYGGAFGSPEVWARLQITCPSTGAVVFDSGEVRRETAFCEPKPYSFRFDSRCPR